MPLIALPRTAGCIVCGPANPYGLHLTSLVDSETATVYTPFTPQPHHIGFDGLVHGGILSTVADEAMVWAAIWVTRRSCVAGELCIRFRRPAAPGIALALVTSIVRAKGRLVEVAATVTEPSGEAVATATGKYLAGSPDDTAAFLATVLVEPASAAALAHLRGA